MFGYNYKVQVVNPSKNIVKLRPTTGTIIKALAPWYILAGIAWLVTNAMEEKADADLKEALKDNPDEA